MYHICVEPQNHGDCDFCPCDVTEFDIRDITYLNLWTAIRPVSHCPDIQMVEDIGDTFEPSPGTRTSDADLYDAEKTEPQPFLQSELE